MSCTTCHSRFTFFTREHGCPNCGFSHCSKCLKYKYSLPDIGVKKICGSCYNKFKSVKTMEPDSSTTDSPQADGVDEPLAPIDITKKLDSLENPAKPPITLYQNTSHWDKFKTGLEPADQEIVDRLRKLKDEDQTVPSVDDIKQRLAVLKDDSPELKPYNIHHIDTRTDQQKANDLIQEYLERLELESPNDPAKDIETRLHSLKDTTEDVEKRKYDDSLDDDDDNEEEVVKKLIEKALAEAALEQKYEDVDELEEMEQ